MSQPWRLPPVLLLLGLVQGPRLVAKGARPGPLFQPMASCGPAAAADAGTTRCRGGSASTAKLPVTHPLTLASTPRPGVATGTRVATTIGPPSLCAQ
eukprot:7330226-Pyramimonas_sp.AAC.1